jgi:hypothetical protein
MLQIFGHEADVHYINVSLDVVAARVILLDLRTFRSTAPIGNAAAG